MPVVVDTIGRSVAGQPIEVHRFGTATGGRLILGGMHGDEPKTVTLLRNLCAMLMGRAYEGGLGALSLVVCVNPDGYARRKRRNAAGVDLNRNFPASNWSKGKRTSKNYGGSQPQSEPETRAIVELILRSKPIEVISVHSISGGRECNNYDGPGRALAEAVSQYNGYPVTPTIGYATPGSFGSWVGHDLGVPMVTLELPAMSSAKQCWERNRRALLVGRFSQLSDA